MIKPGWENNDSLGTDVLRQEVAVESSSLLRNREQKRGSPGVKMGYIKEGMGHGRRLAGEEE